MENILNRPTVDIYAQRCANDYVPGIAGTASFKNIISGCLPVNKIKSGKSQECQFMLRNFMRAQNFNIENGYPIQFCMPKLDQHNILESLMFGYCEIQSKAVGPNSCDFQRVRFTVKKLFHVRNLFKKRS